MRPRDDRVSRLVKSLPGGRRAAAFIAIAITAGALGLLLVFGIGGGSRAAVDRSGDSPFYLEGAIVVLGVAPSNESRPEESRSTLQWWFQSSGVWRWQLDIEPAEDDPMTVLGLADGKNAYLYRSDSNTYTRVALKDYNAAGLPVSFLLGPVDMSRLIETWEAQGTNVRGGTATRFMNREAQILEYSPTWRSSGTEGDRSGGIGRVWIDNDTGLVLRNLVDGGPTSQYLDARVTLLELEPRFDATTFRFEVPSGAMRVEEN